jgi:hypothetical protein
MVLMCIVDNRVVIEGNCCESRPYALPSRPIAQDTPKFS